MKGEKLNLAQLKDALSYCLKAVDSDELMSQYKSRKSVEERLQQFPKPWWTYIPNDVPDHVKGVSSSESEGECVQGTANDGSADLEEVNTNLEAV